MEVDTVLLSLPGFTVKATQPCWA